MALLKIARFQVKNDEGNPFGKYINHHLDEDNILGVLLKRECIWRMINNGEGLGRVGHFYTPQLPSKLVVLRVKLPDWVTPGCLVKFSRKMFEQNFEKLYLGSLTFSTVKLTYLDDYPYFETGEIEKRRDSGILKFEVDRTYCSMFVANSSIDHFIFGRITFNMETIKNEAIEVYINLDSTTDNLAVIRFEIKAVPEEVKIPFESESLPLEDETETVETVESETSSESDEENDDTDESVYFMESEDENDLEVDIIDWNDANMVHGIVLHHSQYKGLKFMYVYRHDKTKCLVFQAPISGPIPKGKLVRFSQTEYDAKLSEKKVITRDGVDEKVSTAAVELVENHSIFCFEQRTDKELRFKLKNYDVENVIENEERNYIEHPLFGMITDKFKLIRNGRFEKIQFVTSFDYRQSKVKQYVVYGYQEHHVFTDEEKQLGLLKAAKLEEERRKWDLVETIEVTKVDRSRSRGIRSVVFKRKWKIYFAALTFNKNVQVYLKKNEAEMEQVPENELPYGKISVNSRERTFEFSPNAQHRNLELEIGDDYTFLLKSVKEVRFGRLADSELHLPK